MKLNLAEAPFVSIQGEGPKSGVNSYFIRFFGCNYQCSFCDSKFSWESSSKEKELKVYDSVVEAADISRDWPRIENVVITGGEPLLYQKEIIELIKEFRFFGYKGEFEIETNGSIEFTKEFIIMLLFEQKKVSINFSPKIKYFERDAEIIQENIRKLSRINMPYILKFVDEEDFNINVLEKFTEPLGCSSESLRKIIYLMPECVTREEHLERFERTLTYCIRYGFNFCPRVHILLWDKKKRV